MEVNKAVGYIRVSTEEQARGGISLDMQQAKIRAYADLEGLELVEIFSDEGISGCSIKIRPGVQKAIRMVRDKAVEAVIIYKLDRLARNTVEALEIASLMDQRSVALHSITEKLDTKSAIGRFFFTLLASLAEMERQLIGERIQAAMERKRQKGEPCNGNPPYGHRIIDWQVVPDPTEQMAIKRIHQLREQGHTIHGIYQTLAEEGFVNRKGRPLASTQIHTIITRKAS